MRSLTLPLALLCIQGLCFLVASDVSVSHSSQTGAPCQMGRVGVTTERIISRRARDIITITLTSTSTDTTDCTCTETALSTAANTDETQTTSSLLASSSPQATASRASADVQSISTDTSTTSAVPASTKTTLDNMSTVTDWSVTTVVSFITVTADSPTPLPSKPFTSDISTSLAVNTTSDPTQHLSVSTQYTTVTDTSYTTRWGTTALANTTPTSQSIWSSSSDASTMTESGALFPSSESYGQSSTIMISTATTSTTMVLDTSATDGSQVDTSATSKSNPPTESTIISSRVRSSSEPLVTLVNPVPIPADSSDGQAQTDGRSAMSPSAMASSSKCGPRKNGTMVINVNRTIDFDLSDQSQQSNIHTDIRTTSGLHLGLPATLSL